MGESASYFTAFTVENILFTAVGSAVYWGLNGRTKLQAFILREVVEWLGFSGATKAVTEFFIFLLLGCLVGIGATQPSSVMQAITAGFGWTGLFARTKTRS
jgi:hypothetical protein